MLSTTAFEHVLREIVYMKLCLKTTAVAIARFWLMESSYLIFAIPRLLLQQYLPLVPVCFSQKMVLLRIDTVLPL